MNAILRFSGICLVAIAWWGQCARAQEGEPHCVESENIVQTDSFYFTASDVVGAVGDVVPVDIDLTVESFPSAPLAAAVASVCFDSDSLELVGAVEFSTEVDDVSFITNFAALSEERGHTHVANDAGFVLYTDFVVDGMSGLFDITPTIPYARAYFRITGDPSAEAAVRFCDAEFRLPGGGCLVSELVGPGLSAVSTRHVPATVTIEEGPATNPDRPDTAPEAIIYEETPTEGNTEISFEVGGGIAVPGGSMAIPIWVTSTHEFVGFSASLLFPEDLVHATRVEEHVRNGAIRIDNATGHIGLQLRDTQRRIGREGERVLLATIHFDVLEGALSAGGTLDLSLADNAGWLNWLGIRYRDGLGPDTVGVTGEVQPSVLIQPIVRVQEEPTVGGDVDLDYEVTVTDAVLLLGDLFRGQQEMECPQAADFDHDGSTTLSDAVGILRHLFQGGAPSPNGSVVCSE